jgi:hypothetical protein
MCIAGLTPEDDVTVVSMSSAIALALVWLTLSACAPVLPVSELRYGQSVEEVRETIGYPPAREVRINVPKGINGSMLALEYRVAPSATSFHNEIRPYWLLFYRGILWQHSEGDIRNARVAGRNAYYDDPVGNRLIADTEADRQRFSAVSGVYGLAGRSKDRERDGSRIQAAQALDQTTATGSGGFLFQNTPGLSERIAEDHYRAQALQQARQAQSLRLLGIGSQTGDAHLIRVIRPQPDAPPISCISIQHGSFRNTTCR